MDGWMDEHADKWIMAHPRLSQHGMPWNNEGLIYSVWHAPTTGAKSSALGFAGEIWV